MSFKICSIGCGSMAGRGHGPSYRKYAAQHSDVVLAACADVDEQKARSFQEKFGFQRFYTDFVTMLNNEKPDAVCLMAPEHLTATLSVKILEMGYPLMLEKPPGLNREETMRIIEAAERTGLPNQVAFNRRYTPLVRKLKSLLTQKFHSEEIQDIRYDFFRVGRKDLDFCTTAIHGIDTVKFLAGSPYRYIRFHYQELSHLGPNVANIYMDCSFASGATAHLNFCPVAGVVIERATVNALDNTFFLNTPVWNAYDTPGRLIHLEKGEVKLDISGEEVSDGEEMFETNGFYHENVSFFEDLRAGRKPPGDVRSGLQSVEIAECIRNRVTEYRAEEWRA